MGKIIEYPHIIEIAEEIADVYKSGKKVVVVSAPTGSMKSTIAWFTHIKAQMSAAVLSHQKILQDQYHDLLYTGDPDDFITLKGRDNYKCLIRRDTTAAFAPCAFTKNHGCKHAKDASCPYMKARRLAEESGFMNCNYQYVWNMQDMLGDMFKFTKDLYIYDEAHNIHQLYTDHRSPAISNRDLLFYKKELDWAEQYDAPNLAYCSQKLIDEIRSIDFRKKNNDAYLLEKMARVFELKEENAKALTSYISKNEQDLFETGQIKLLGALDKFECRSRVTYNILKDKGYINDESIVELNQQDDDKFNLTLTAFDIGKLFAEESNLYSEYKLFMSATILGPENFLRNLGYSPKFAHIIELPSKFPVSNRPVYIMPGVNINYDVVTNKPEKLEPMLKMLKELIELKAENNENGIVFTSSYDLTRIVTNYLRMNLDDDKVELLFNMDTSQRDEVLDRFKLITNRPKVLVSCSFFEGVNLNADISRYSVIFKVPYKSLGSKYVKAVMENNSELYKIWALTDIVQACGRSIRSEEDWAESYIFDGAARNLFKYGKKLVPKWFWESIEWVN